MNVTSVSCGIYVTSVKCYINPAVWVYIVNSYIFPRIQEPQSSQELGCGDHWERHWRSECRGSACSGRQKSAGARAT